jgi:hypothetical protein
MSKTILKGDPAFEVTPRCCANKFPVLSLLVPD